MDDERRTSPRIACSLEGAVRQLPGEIEVMNISEGGVFMRGEHLKSARLGQCIELLLHLPLESAPFSIKAKIVRMARDGVGAVFDDPSPSKSRSRYVFNLLRHTMPLEDEAPRPEAARRPRNPGSNESLPRTRRGGALGTILASLKFTPAGLVAVRAAVDLARDTGAAVVVFHAADCHLEDLPAADPRRRSAVENAHKRFENMVRPRLPDSCRVDFHCEPGYPPDAICRAAADFGADLVVIGCHRGKNRLSLDRVELVGMSVFEKAPCKVMLVPYREREDS